MGRKRSVDTGKVDSLGRKIKISSSSPTPAQHNPHAAQPKEDFPQTHPSLTEPPPTPALTKEYCHDVSEWLLHNINIPHPLMATVHGSYLYGTAHEGSDLDLYVVSLDGKNKSSVVAGLDVQIMNLKTFTELVNTGSHQAVEALYSPYTVFPEDSEYTPYIKSLRPSPYNFVKKARSAGKAFAESGTEKGLRHADRLEQASQEMMKGEYTPIYRDLPDY